MLLLFSPALNSGIVALKGLIYKRTRNAEMEVYMSKCHPMAEQGRFHKTVYIQMRRCEVER